MHTSINLPSVPGTTVRLKLSPSCSHRAKPNHM